MQNGNLITQKKPQLKRTLPKFLLQCYFRLTVLQLLNKNVHGKLSNLRTQIKVGRFWKLALVFFSSRVINMLFLLPFMSNLPSRKGVENKHHYDGCVCVCGGALSWSTVKFSKLMVKKNGKENRQQLVKMITCLNFGLKVHSNLKPSDKQFVLQ